MIIIWTEGAAEHLPLSLGGWGDTVLKKMLFFRNICKVVITHLSSTCIYQGKSENELFRCTTSLRLALGLPNIPPGMLGCWGQPFSLAPCCAPRVLHSLLMLKVISPHADKLSVCFGSPNGGAVMGLSWRSLWGLSMCHRDVELCAHVCVFVWMQQVNKII